MTMINHDNNIQKLFYAIKSFMFYYMENLKTSPYEIYQLIKIKNCLLIKTQLKGSSIFLTLKIKSQHDERIQMFSIFDQKIITHALAQVYQ
jgi:hypothetical protein